MVVNDAACLLTKRGALESIVGTPPGASSLLQKMSCSCCGMVPRQKGANSLVRKAIGVISKLFEKNLN